MFEAVLYFTGLSEISLISAGRCKNSDTRVRNSLLMHG
jgi:hypothetical protein